MGGLCWRRFLVLALHLPGCLHNLTKPLTHVEQHATLGAGFVSTKESQQLRQAGLPPWFASYLHEMKAGDQGYRGPNICLSFNI